MAGDQGSVLLELYDEALPQVFGYLRPRCGDETVAEDLTAETFLAAVSAIERGKVPQLTVAWLIGVARHKLADHWRRKAREERKLRKVESEPDRRERRPVGRTDRRRPRPRGARRARRPSPRARSPCGTWTGCPSPRWPTTSAAPSTPPRRSWCEPGPPSATPTGRRSTDAARPVRRPGPGDHADRSPPGVRRRPAPPHRRRPRAGRHHDDHDHHHVRDPLEDEP